MLFPFKNKVTENMHKFDELLNLLNHTFKNEILDANFEIRCPTSL